MRIIVKIPLSRADISMVGKFLNQTDIDTGINKFGHTAQEKTVWGTVFQRKAMKHYEPKWQLQANRCWN